MRARVQAKTLHLWAVRDVSGTCPLSRPGVRRTDTLVSDPTSACGAKKPADSAACILPAWPRPLAQRVQCGCCHENR
jgi:hypothetical protein